jgi:hypothetical protein
VPQLTDQGLEKINELSRRYGLSTDAVITLLQSLLNSNGSMAQFDHRELGGSGQWMPGGMTMVGDMFNHGLKAKVDGLCSELSELLVIQPDATLPASFFLLRHHIDLACHESPQSALSRRCRWKKAFRPSFLSGTGYDCSEIRSEGRARGRLFRGAPGSPGVSLAADPRAAAPNDRSFDAGDDGPDISSRHGIPNW